MYDSYRRKTSNPDQIYDQNSELNQGRTKCMEKYSMFIEGNTQYCLLVIYSQLDQQIQCDPNKNPSKLFCTYQQTDSKVCKERQKTKNNQNNIEEEQSWRTDTTQLQDFL